MLIEYGNRNGKRFEELRTGTVFEQFGNVYMKIDQVYIEVLSVVKKYNAVALKDGKLEYFGPDVSVNCINTKLVIC